MQYNGIRAKCEQPHFYDEFSEQLYEKKSQGLCDHQNILKYY